MFSPEYIRQLNRIASEDPSERRILFDQDLQDLRSYTVDPACDNEEWILRCPFGHEVMITSVVGHNYFDLTYDIGGSSLVVSYSGSYEEIESLLWAINEAEATITPANEERIEAVADAREANKRTAEAVTDLAEFIGYENEGEDLLRLLTTKPERSQNERTAEALANETQLDPILLGDYRSLQNERTAEAVTVPMIEPTAEGVDLMDSEAVAEAERINNCMLNEAIITANEAEAVRSAVDLNDPVAVAEDLERLRSLTITAVAERDKAEAEAEATKPIKRIDILRMINKYLIQTANEAEAKRTAEAVDQCAICCDSPTYDHDLYMRTIHGQQDGQTNEAEAFRLSKAGSSGR